MKETNTCSADKTGNRVSISYLECLKDLDAIHGNAGVVLLREQLDVLNEKEVCWDPYHAHRDVRPLQEFVYYNGLLVCFNVAEPYYPDRVLRQFGRVQIIPKKTMKPSNDQRGKKQGQYKVKYNVDNWILESWENHLLANMSRTEPVKDQWDARANYMGWFTKISHVLVQNPKNAIEHVWKAKVVEVQGPVEDNIAEGRKAVGLLKKIDFDGERQGQVNKTLLREAI
ncbi:hypothetical protein LguiB_027373 [Lonicera macranthoides]